MTNIAMKSRKILKVREIKMNKTICEQYKEHKNAFQHAIIEAIETFERKTGVVTTRLKVDFSLSLVNNIINKSHILSVNVDTNIDNNKLE